jgi:hypothetical protein
MRTVGCGAKWRFSSAYAHTLLLYSDTLVMTQMAASTSLHTMLPVLL